MDIVTVALLSAALLAGGALGALLGVLAERARHGSALARVRAERDAAIERLSRAAADDERLADRVHRLSAETLAQVETRLNELERARASADAALAQEVRHVRLGNEQLRRETAALVTALRKPQVRGRWGEMHLRRAVELAGLVERCDFDEQVSTPTADGLVRPDLVVHLAGDRHIVVDAKAPLEAFLDVATADEHHDGTTGVPGARWHSHARQLRAHVDALASKAYWRQLGGTPEFVVLFLPGEAILSAALDADPELIEHAARRKVVLATPTTLIGLLRTVAYGWTQDAVAREARRIHELGRELFDRLGSFGRHLDRVGRSLNGAVGAYNSAVGSFESRVLVSARRLGADGDLGDLGGGTLSAPAVVEEPVRSLVALETGT